MKTGAVITFADGITPEQAKQIMEAVNTFFRLTPLLRNDPLFPDNPVETVKISEYDPDNTFGEPILYAPNHFPK